MNFDLFFLNSIHARGGRIKQPETHIMYKKLQLEGGGGEEEEEELKSEKLDTRRSVRTYRYTHYTRLTRTYLPPTTACSCS